MEGHLHDEGADEKGERGYTRLRRRTRTTSQKLGNQHAQVRGRRSAHRVKSLEFGIMPPSQQAAARRLVDSFCAHVKCQ